MRIISPYKDNFIDPPLMPLLNRIQETDLDFICVPITRKDGFEFNPELLTIKKPWVLIDFCEYGWDYQWDKNYNFESSDFGGQLFDSLEWRKFNQFCVSVPPVLVFKRELLKTEVTETRIPIEYPCLYEIPEPVSEEDYNARPITLVNLWGLSHPVRPIIHADIWVKSQRYGYEVLDNLKHINPFFEENPAGSKKVVVTSNIPHYSRYPMQDVIYVYGLSMFGLSLPGAGVKCFRHSEVPMNTVMFKTKDDLAWSYPWDANNSIIFNSPNDLPMHRLRDANYYTRYLAGVENCRNYQLENYVRNYILKNIREALK